MKKVLLSLFLCVTLLAVASCEGRFGKSFDESAATATAKVDAPIISPQTGSFPAGTLITISSATGDATIKYTIDGTEPSETNGTTYTQPVELSSATIKAIAIKEQMDDSEITSASYSVQAPYSPQFSQPGGTYANPVTVSLSAQGDYDEIKYTTNGSDPHDGTVYTAPVAINVTGTAIRAITINAGVISPESGSGQYIFKAATPAITHSNCPTIEPNCPAVSLPNSGLTSSIKMSLVSDLYAGVPVTPPTPVTINCTKCIFLTSATTGATLEWRYVYTPVTPGGTGTGTGTEEANLTDAKALGTTPPSALVYSNWTTFCQKIACSAIVLPQGVTAFKIQARAVKAGMLTSDIGSLDFYK